MSHHRFPLSAVVGQETLLTAYLANIVLPEIGGLLISGPKGTGKSTVVHAIEPLLPDYEAVAGCPFRCDPARPDRLCSGCRERSPFTTARHPMRVVNLPLSCTEDRLIGSLDIEVLIGEGKRRVQPGLLGEANRNLLYVDEVNLLPDHLVDDTLDAAAGHWTVIEREGVSFSHPSDFVLVGTMNPEEGDLRPQILDRFPLCARIETVRDPVLRAEIVRRNLLFERDPAGLHAHFAQEEAVLREVILRAREEVKRVRVEESVLDAVARAASDLKVDGQRPDIVIVKTALAIAAIAAASARPGAADGPTRVERDHVLLAAELALNHRTRDGGLLDPPTREEIRDTFRRAFEGPAFRVAAGSPSGVEMNAVHKQIGSFLRLVVPADGPADSGSESAPGGSAAKKT